MSLLSANLRPGLGGSTVLSFLVPPCLVYWRSTRTLLLSFNDLKDQNQNHLTRDRVI